ncbi:phenoloxidase-activating factor 2 [Drosophila teissieri]|uniref:phenoloxidase-activating factor 2 n=1 Tax=Drosophila teissieri TaxID=7243 RepID=UPI001CBA51A2|nr:phenoloxidase-activating factor 2 [Drosophila teissieri]
MFAWALIVALFVFGAAENENAELLLSPTKCGQANPNVLKVDSNVTDGQAKPGEFPWTIAVIHNESLVGVGSLIAPNVVLTAAHQIFNKDVNDLIVSAGEWKYADPSEEYPIEEASVKQMVVHELFDYRKGENNLALLFLEQHFPLTFKINTICLPTQRRSLSSTRCVVAGWGKHRFSDKDQASVLKKIDLPIVPRDVCQEKLRKTRLGPKYTLPRGLICAGGEKDTDACTGDGGAALFCPMTEDPQQFEQIGIVNFGVGCNEENVPGTYTDVFEYKPWIDRHLEVKVYLPDDN